MSAEKKYLKLVFARDLAAAKCLLRVAHVPLAGNPETPLSWPKLRGRHRPLRGLCILLLLARHRHEHSGEQEMRFDVQNIGDIKAKNHWINALAQYREVHGVANEIKQYLQIANCFFDCRRGSAAGPYAEYHNQFFNITEVRFFQVGENGETETPVLDFADFAIRLEAPIAEAKYKRWTSIVPHLIDETNGLPKKTDKDSTDPESKGAKNKTYFMQSPWTACSAFEGDVGEKILECARNPIGRPNWYIISLLPTLDFGPRRSEWETLVLKAIDSSFLTIKWAFQATEGRVHESIRNQWLVQSEIVGSDEEKIEHFRWQAKGKKFLCFKMIEAARYFGAFFGGYKDNLRFFESNIVHPFSCILCLPDRWHALAEQAPKGASCFIQPHPIFPMNKKHMCGFYLEGPSPMMDFYFRTIIDFFEVGIRNKCLKPLDPESLNTFPKKNTT